MKVVPSSREADGCWEDIYGESFSFMLPKEKRSWDSLGGANVTTGPPVIPLYLWQCACLQLATSTPLVLQWLVRTWKTMLSQHREKGWVFYACRRTLVQLCGGYLLFPCRAGIGWVSMCTSLDCVWSDLLLRDRPSLSLRPEIVDLGLEPVFLTQFCPQPCTKLLFERVLWLFWMVSPTTFFIMTFGQKCRLGSVGWHFRKWTPYKFPFDCVFMV